MALREKPKTVAFFEIRDAKGDPFPEPLPWDKHLADISRESAEARKHRVGEAAHWGQVYTRHETDHLILARYRDDVSSYDIATGDIVDTASDSAKPWVELSVIHFLPETNRIGYVLGSHAAPRISALQGWINIHALVQGGVTIEPVLSKRVLQKIHGAAEASVLRVKYDSRQLDLSSEDDSAAIAEIKRLVGSKLHHTSVELVFRVEGGMAPGLEEERVRVLKIAKEVSADDFKAATAKLVNYDEKGRPRAEDVDFLKHRLARKEKVTITDKDGKSVKIASAIDAIYRAASRFGDELYEKPTLG